MTRLPTAVRQWVRQNLAWSNSRLDWQERLGLGVLAGAAALAWWFGDRLAAGPAVAQAGLLLVTLAVLFRRGWLKLLGPVVVYEVVRTTRRSHFVLYRLYAYFILILLSLCYFIWAVRTPGDSPGFLTVPAREMPAFTGAFVYTFLSLQVLLLAVLTPAYVAGGLAEEKDRGTLEFLLATDLRDREIVLGKLLARLGNLLLILLTGLPVVAFLQFLGGVDPWLVLAGFAATAMTMVGLAGVSILNSVYARKPRNAIVLTFVQAAAYLVVTVLLPLLTLGTGFLSWSVPGLGGLTPGDALAWLDAGNPILQVIQQARDLASGISLADSLPTRLAEYAGFHATLALVCVAWASARLRAVFRQQVYERVRPAGLGRGGRHLRRVGRWPVAWKEVFAEPAARFRWFGTLVLAAFVIGSLLYVGQVAVSPRPGVQAQVLLVWSRIVGGLVGCLLLVRVAVHASTSLTGERERQTFDGLLVTPLSAREILVGKWLGSVVCVRWGWLWLGGIWALGVWWGGLHPLAVVLLVTAWAVYAATLALIGLWFSLRAASSLRATVLTLLTGLALGFSYAVYLPLDLFRATWAEPNSLLTQLNRLQEVLSPLLTLTVLIPFSRDPDPRGALSKEAWELPTALLGLLIWAVAGVVLWMVLHYRLRQVTGRLVLRRPEREPLAERRELEPAAVPARTVRPPSTLPLGG